VIAAVLLPIPFLPVGFQLALAGFFMFFMTAHLIIIINAIAETTRFNMISSVWIFGIEAFFVVLGVGVGNLVFWWGFGVSGNPTQDAALCAGTVIVCGFMQVFIQMQSYPIVKELDNGPVARQDFDDDRELSSANRAFWRTRLNVIADQYDLSPRQREVMELLIKGRDTNYIMDHFVISRATVKTHVYNLYKKLAVHSRQELLDLIERANG
jgi:DNA-binding CsgD family transcriptional regulator